jgi:methyltransferase (TIGR00027 family)
MARTDSERSEGDSWDLASSVGATATAVAASRALASKGPSPLIDDPFAEPLVKAVGLEVYIRMAEGAIDIEGDPLLSRERSNEQMAVRTRFFDDFFIDGTAAGVRQAVILAAGLDARAYRLAWPAGTVVYEVDQPQVIEFKTRTLDGIGAAPTAERRTVGIDLRDDWPTALRNTGFDASQPTDWIAEGLLVYLPPEAQDRLFDNITALSAPGSRVATEHIADMSVFSGKWADQLSERWRRVGSDVDLSALVYHGERSHVIDYLTSRGWDVTAHTTKDMYTANGFTFPDDEIMAAFADSSYISATLK